MARAVFLLRGVNVGGRNVVPMPTLRVALAQAGFGDVVTYVNSGNVIATPSTDDLVDAADVIRRVIESEFGVTTPVVARTPAQIADVLAWAPFPQIAADAPARLHVLFLDGDPDAGGVEELLSADWGADGVAVRGREVALGYAESMHTSKLAYVKVLRLLRVDGTARNWRTVVTLHSLV